MVLCICKLGLVNISLFIFCVPLELNNSRMKARNRIGFSAQVPAACVTCDAISRSKSHVTGSDKVGNKMCSKRTTISFVQTWWNVSCM